MKILSKYTASLLTPCLFLAPAQVTPRILPMPLSSACKQPGNGPDGQTTNRLSQLIVSARITPKASPCST